MDWIWGAALLPLLACGAMCIGGMALAAVGFRRRDRSDDRSSDTGTHDQVSPSR